MRNAVHYKLEFDSNKSLFNELGKTDTSATSVKIIKNKIGPLTEKMPFTIDNKLGGRQIKFIHSGMQTRCDEEKMEHLLL
ncbi:MAG: hypothetical protein LBF68_06485 [Christensenellaceae bacterium]|jgi:hypothetical protein|nr:hypothetical protein [Christensenellaceae bacterium]